MRFVQREDDRAEAQACPSPERPLQRGLEVAPEGDSRPLPPGRAGAAPLQSGTECDPDLPSCASTVDHQFA